MRSEQYRHAGIVQVGEQVQYLVAGTHVDARRGFIEHQNIG